MAAHPYWRLGIASGSLYVELKELAFLDAAGNDTSVGGTASASSEYSSSYSADKAFDKNLSTMWDINSGGFPAYIQYHTSTPVDVAFVKLTSSGAYSWSGLTLSYSDNGSTWSTPTTLNVVSGGPPSSGVETVLAAPVRRNPLVLVGSKVVELPAGDKINGVSADLADKENLIAAGTTAHYWRGDKSWQPLNKSAVGLGNVDNTSDADKPVSTATQAALDAKLAAANPSVTGTITEDVYAITDSAGVTIDPANGSIQTWTLGANRTPTLTSIAAGQAVTLEITAGAYAITWTGVTWVKVGGSGTAPTLSTTGVSTVVLWKVGSTLKGCYLGST